MPCQLLKSEWKNMGEDSAGFGRNGNVVSDGEIKFLERVTPCSLADKRQLCRGTPYFCLERVRVEMPVWRLYLSTTVPCASVISLHTYSPGLWGHWWKGIWEMRFPQQLILRLQAVAWLGGAVVGTDMLGETVHRMHIKAFLCHEDAGSFCWNDRTCLPDFTATITGGPRS